MESVNPFTGQINQRYQSHTPAEVDAIATDVDRAFQVWKQTPFSLRSKRMNRLADLLLEKKEEMALLIVSEMGKIKREALGEVEKCAWVCRYYASEAESHLAPEQIPTEAPYSHVAYVPLGTVLAVMPWNFPFWQVFRFLAPALMAGNTGLLKHAGNVPGCALAIEQLVREAGFPENVFRSLLIGGSQVKPVILNPKVKAVTLTGSTPAGKAVAEAAGSVLKKSVLELGGSDPYLILEDADVEKAAGLCVFSRLLNAGQSCIGAKRFIALKPVYQAFVNAFVRRMEEATYGDPLDTRSSIGPLARTDLRNELHEQVRQSVSAGARVLCGGFIPDTTAPFYPPTVLVDVKPGMPAYHDELFGPVAVIFSAETVDEAVHIANDTCFGLGAGVFTANLEMGLHLAETGLQAGCVFVNDFVKSDPRLPFGGIGESGYGRELSVHGIREFVNIKTIVGKPS